MTVQEYIIEFEQLYRKLKANNMELPNGVLACRVLAKLAMA